MNENQNPLIKHYRSPSLYVSLPSKGRYYTSSDVEYPESGEVPVFPMTAKDEILMNTPDALMNGECTKDIIESCVPNIKDGFSVCSIDFDVILLAIRIASYGNTMDLTTVCPECNEKNEYEIDLRMLLDEIHDVDYSEPLVINDSLKVFFKPVTYRHINKTNIKTFEQERLLRVDNTATSDEEQLKSFNNSIKIIASISLEMIVDNIAYMEDNGEKVETPGYISEYLDNCDNKYYKMIQAHISKIKGQLSTQTNSVTVKCMECSHEYEAPILLEASNFFG